MEQAFHDEYFDTAQCELARSDTWLRKREGKWELKGPKLGDGSADVRLELADPALISAALKALLKAACASARVSELGGGTTLDRLVDARVLQPLASFTTVRRKFHLPATGATIDLDRAWWGSKADTVYQMTPLRGRILCFGDSLTEGLTLDGPYEVLHPYSDRLGELLAGGPPPPPPRSGPHPAEGGAALVEGQPRRGVVTYSAFDEDARPGVDAAAGIDMAHCIVSPDDVVNAGVSGERADEMRGRLAAALAEHPSDVVVVLAGTNDVQQAVFAGARLDPAVVAADIVALWDQCLAAGAAVVAVTIPREREERLLPEAARAETNGLLRDRAEAVATAPESGVPHVVVVDADDVFGPGADAELWCLDNLHFSPAGYDALAAALVVPVRRALEAGLANQRELLGGPDVEIGEVEVLASANGPAAAADAAAIVNATLEMIGCEPCVGAAYRSKISCYMAEHRPGIYEELVALGRLRRVARRTGRP